MKKILALSLVLVAIAPAAKAQEQQVYYPPYITRNAITQEDLIARQNYILLQQQARMTGTYIPRDPNATYRDKIPYHPGDYRDAYDRGELPRMGGTSQKTGRPVTRY